MKKTIQTIYKIHSWVGLLIGLLLLLISLSGSLLVFYEEIDHALNPALLRVKEGGHKLPLNQVYANAKQRFPEAEQIRFRRLPARSDHSIELNIVKEGNFLLVYVDPYTGHVLGERKRFAFLMDWLLRFHYSLFAAEIGELTVALLGVLLIISLLTGVLVYRKYIVKVLLFKVPLKFKNWRQGSSELHRIIGVWSMVFNLIIAVSGCYMLYHILLNAYAASKQETIVKTPIELKVSLNNLLTIADKELAGFVPYSISVPSDSTAPITITGRVADPNPLSSAYSSYISFNQHTGQIVKIFNIRHQKLTAQVDKAMYPLHFGNYGGIVVKIIYSLFGLTPSILAVTGFLLWWRQRRKRKGKIHPSNKSPNKKVFVTAKTPLKN